MARWLFPSSTFSPLIGLETPPIANLSFATFLGDKSLSSRDATNIITGASFIVQGAGPSYSSNYAVFSPGNCLTTGMQDIIVSGVYPHTLVFVAAPTPLNYFSTYLSFTSTNYTDTRIDSLVIGTAPNQIVNIRSQAGTIANGGSSTDCPFNTVDQNQWNIFAVVYVTGKNIKVYNLTSGVTSTSSTASATTNRPSGGQWNIGCLTSTYTNPSKIAFALGANTEMTQADLNTLAAALRYPLVRRGIVI